MVIRSVVEGVVPALVRHGAEPLDQGLERPRPVVLGAEQQADQMGGLVAARAHEPILSEPPADDEGAFSTGSEQIEEPVQDGDQESRQPVMVCASGKIRQSTG